VPCSPLDCGPQAVTVAGGGVLALQSRGAAKLYDLTSGKRRAILLDTVLAPNGRRAVSHAGRGRLLVTYDLGTGRVVTRTRVAGGWTLAGVSRDATSLVLLAETSSTTRVAVITGNRRQTLVLPGVFSFDGLRGTRLYLIQHVREGYYVRVADLATGKLLPDPLKDADEPALINGQAWSRLASPDGRYVFTIYVDLGGSGSAMIHELDLQEGKAWCVDLPGSGNFNAAGSYALALSADGKRLYAAGGGYGTVATVDVDSHRITHVAHVPAAMANAPSLPSASVSRDGKTLAFANAGNGWVFDLAGDRLVRTLQLPADAVVAYAPSGKLWTARYGSGLRPAPA
jgi:DNA-binding beta-propeller fold protein YncE